jgi:hypothetical protein
VPMPAPTGAIWMTWRLTAPERPPAPRSVGNEAAALILCPVVVRQLADSAGFSGIFRLAVLHTREGMPVSRASPASQAPSPARRAAFPAVRGMIAVAGVAGSGMASAGRARVARSGQLPGRRAEVVSGAAARRLARSHSSPPPVVSALPWA